VRSERPTARRRAETPRALGTPNPRHLALALTVTSALCACGPPTLSRTRGEAYAAALAEARRHHHHGRMRDAAASYARAAEVAVRRVDRDEARYRQAKALERAGNLEAALALLDAVAQAKPRSRRTGRARFDAARLRLKLGDRTRAVAGLLDVVRLHPDHGLASRALVWLLRARDEDGVDHASTIAWLEALYAEVGSRDVGDDLLIAIAERHLRLGDVTSARAALLRCADEHPYPTGQRFDDALWRLADLEEEHGNPAAAVAHLERLVSYAEATGTPGSYTLPRMPAAQLRIARLRRDALHDPEGARAAYRALRARFPSSTLVDDALVEEAELELARGDHTAACTLLRRALAEHEVGRARRRAARLLDTACR
jgi:tetratricopeptide (TPR) repeat protein